MGIIGISDSLLLIALAGGYIVLYLARREEKFLRIIGVIIGCVIIGSSLAYIFTNSWMEGKIWGTKRCHYRKYTPSRMMMQPDKMPAIKR